MSMVQSKISTIRSLTHIKAVTLEDLTWPLIPVELRQIIATLDLTSLSLSFVFFTSSWELFDLVSTFSNLDTLLLGYGIRWVSPTYGALAPKPLKFLRKLSVDTSRELVIPPLLQLISSSLSIDALELCSFSPLASALIDELLYRTTPEHLTLDFGKFGQGPTNTGLLDLSSHTYLRSLALQGITSSRNFSNHPNFTWTACMSILSSIKSRSMESLIIYLQHSPSLSDSDWATFDDILDRDAFRNLESVRFVTDSPGSQSITFTSETVSAYLPKANTRSILEFQ
ncbi:hypothetical protein AX17_002620 [Amanita inopinata Kibby_2008]|nr:hypothetical protein AX17_002620 [Amanita inopinata Kibby_2008]